MLLKPVQVLPCEILTPYGWEIWRDSTLQEISMVPGLSSAFKTCFVFPLSYIHLSPFWFLFALYCLLSTSLLVSFILFQKMILPIDMLQPHALSVPLSVAQSYNVITALIPPEFNTRQITKSRCLKWNTSAC